MQLITISGKRTLPFWNRRSVRLAALGSVLALGAFLRTQIVLEPFHAWRSKRSLARAKDAVQKGDAAGALLSLQIAAQLAPFDRSGLLIAGDTLEILGSPESVSLRERILALDSSDDTARSDLVRTALRFRDLRTAEQALAGFTESQRTNLGIQHLDAAFSAIARTPAEYEGVLVKILQQHPEDELTRVELARLQLHRPEAASIARAILKEVPLDNPLRKQICRELAAEALSRSAAHEAIEWAEQVARDSRATFEDQLFRIELEYQLGSPKGSRHLTELQRSIETEPKQVATLASWMLLHGFTPATLAWLHRLPLQTRDAPAVRSLYVDIAVLQNDWPAVCEGIRQGAWGQIQANVIENVASAHHLREIGDTTAVQGKWEMALRIAQHHLPSLLALYRLALAENDAACVDTSLRALARSPGAEEWATRQLMARAYENRDTSTIKELLTQAIEKEPSNIRVKIDWAYIMLLQNRAAPSSLVKGYVQSAWDRFPNDRYTITTRAFCLLRLRQKKQAIEMIERLSSSQLSAPGPALLYGVLLVANGRVAEAKSFLGIARGAPLLPEERALLDEALPPGSLEDHS